MKILYVVNNPDFFISHRLPIAREARALGYEVHVATPVGLSVGEIRNHGFIFHPIVMDRSKGRPWREATTVFRLYRLYREVQPDLVHHVTIKPVLYGSLAASIAGVPAVVNAVSGLGYVFLAHGMKAALIRSLVKALYRIAFKHRNIRIIFQNPDDAAFFLEEKLLKKEQIVLIKGSGADTRTFAPVPEPAGRPIVLLASRLLWDKGIREFVAAASELKARNVDARFVLAGSVDSGNPASIPETWVREIEKDGIIEWWGQMEKMAEVLGMSNIVCLPSYREGLPKVLIEAAACGRPIVTTDVPGCREIVRNRENGLLVPIRDADSLANAIETLLADPDMRKRLGARGREMVEAEFSTDRVVEATLRLYAESISALGTGSVPISVFNSYQVKEAL